MTTMTMETTASVRRLEELVDRLLAALLGGADVDTECGNVGSGPGQDGPPGPAAAGSPATWTARWRCSSGVDTGRSATDAQELRWLYGEWLDITLRRFAGGGALLYSPATGKGGGPGGTG